MLSTIRNIVCSWLSTQDHKADISATQTCKRALMTGVERVMDSECDDIDDELT